MSDNMFDLSYKIMHDNLKKLVTNAVYMRVYHILETDIRIDHHFAFDKYSNIWSEYW